MKIYDISHYFDVLACVVNADNQYPIQLIHNGLSDAKEVAQDMFNELYGIDETLVSVDIFKTDYNLEPQSHLDALWSIREST